MSLRNRDTQTYFHLPPDLNDTIPNELALEQWKKSKLLPSGFPWEFLLSAPKLNTEYIAKTSLENIENVGS